MRNQDEDGSYGEQRGFVKGKGVLHGRGQKDEVYPPMAGQKGKASTKERRENGVLF